MEVNLNAFTILDPAGREHDGAEAASMLPRKIPFHAVDLEATLGESLLCLPPARPAGILRVCSVLLARNQRPFCLWRGC